MGKKRMHPHRDTALRTLSGAGHWRTRRSERWDIDSLVLSDGPNGLRKQEGAQDHLGIAASRPATCFPALSTLTCSFDPGLVRRVGAALGEEARDQGVDMVLGPGVNIKRHPMCGRNFEYFSEDPLLSGVLGAAMVRGIQSRGVSACVKHLAANNQEYARMVSDSVVDERTLHELYLRPFEIAVRQGRPWAVMSAYNKLNGTYCTQNYELLTSTLRRSWGFDGVVVSDWGAMSDAAASVAAGMDLCMPGPRPDLDHAVRRAVSAGLLRATDVAATYDRLSRLSRRVRRGKAIHVACDYEAHAELVREAAASSSVLLENDGILPLRPSVSMAVIGAFAREPRYQGAGSSKINPRRLVTPLSALRSAAPDLVFAPGYEVSTGMTTPELLDEAGRAAAAADVAVVVAGLPARYESEGFDRKLMVMPHGQIELIQRVCRENPACVVVLQGGAPMEMPWRHMPSAILMTYLSGESAGPALADVLFGRVNPSGKLAETWPNTLEQTALGSEYPEMNREVLYREGPFVGYRYYDAVHVAPAYPFGYGRSYTSFSIDAPVLTKTSRGVGVSVRVCNAGGMRGAEVLQVYVERPQSASRPGVLRELVAFQKVDLASGESRSFTIRISDGILRAWDPVAHAWCLPSGTYRFLVGTSSRDLPYSLSYEPSSAVPLGTCRVPDAYVRPVPHGFDEESFKGLYGRALPSPAPIFPFSVDSTLRDMTATWFGRRVIGLLSWVVAGPARKMDRDQRAMMREMAAEMPVRSLTSSGVPLGVVDAFVRALNGRYVTGVASALYQLGGWVEGLRKKARRAR